MNLNLLNKVSTISVGIIFSFTINALAQPSAFTKGQIYTYESGADAFNTKNYFYNNGSEVIAFDTQFTNVEAKKSIEFLRTKTKNPISYLVITHPNPDKFNAIRLFQDMGAKVIVSENTAADLPKVHDYKKDFFVNKAKMFTNENYPKLGKPDIIFQHSYTLKLKNGDQVDLKELALSGISSHQTVALIKKVDALIVGDLIHYKVHAWLEGGLINGTVKPNIKNWISDLEEILSTYSQYPKLNIYAGRGATTLLTTAVSEQTQYLLKAEEIVKKYILDLGEKKSELDTAKAQNHYEKLKSLFEKEFPDYKYSYMIQYSVYGLVNSLK